MDLIHYNLADLLSLMTAIFTIVLYIESTNRNCFISFQKVKIV